MKDKQPPPLPPLGLALRHAHLRAARLFAEQLGPLGLENVQAGVLIELNQLGPRTQRQLMDLVRLDKSAMVRTIDYLESRGLVRRGQHPTDRRAHAVELTEEGACLLTELLGAADRTEQRLLAGLTPEQRAVFRTLLVTVAELAPGEAAD